MLLLIALLACSKGPAPDPTTHALDDPELSPCMDGCLERTMAQPVAYASLLADCKDICAVDYVVRDASDTVQLRGERVLAVGTYQRTLHHGHGPEPYMGTAVVLSDDTPLWISTGEPPDGWEDALETEVEVQGTLVSGPDGDPDLWLNAPERAE